MNVLLVEAPGRGEFRTVEMWLLQAGGTAGRTWFLETLLPSGRKHRAPGYEPSPGTVFRERYISARGSYPRIPDEKTAHHILPFFRRYSEPALAPK